MTQPIEGEADDEAAQVELGRRYVRVAAIALVLVDATIGALTIARLGTDHAPRLLVRLALTALLAVFLARGSAWARWLTLGVVALALMALTPAFAGDAFSGERLPGTIAVLVLFLGYGVLGRALLWSTSVRAFFRAARRKQPSGARAA